jgi:hypothetical protein
MNFLRGAVSAAAGAVGNTINAVTSPGAEDKSEGSPKILRAPDLNSVKPVMSLRYEDGKEDPPESCGRWHKECKEWFQLRAGPDYARTKTKADAGPPLTELVGIDMIKSACRIDNIGRYLDFPQEWKQKSKKIDGVPDLFIVCVQIPSEGLGGGLASFFKDQDDGPGVSLVFYFKIRENFCSMLQNPDTTKEGPAANLFANFCKEAPEMHGDPDDTWRGRFKVIVNCTNIDEYGLPNFITSYNGKPVLIRQTGSVYRGDNYVEQDINCHAFGMVARKALGILLEKFPYMLFDIGFCIESRDDDEMPEALLGCGTVNGPKQSEAVDWDTFCNDIESDVESDIDNVDNDETLAEKVFDERNMSGNDEVVNEEVNLLDL